MYTCEAVHIVKGKNYALEMEFWKFLNSCERKNGQFFKVPKGVENPWGHMTIDDLIAIAEQDHIWAEDILNHFSWWFYWTTPNPNKPWTQPWFMFPFQCMLGRYRGAMAHIKMCSGQKVNFIDLIFWIYDLVAEKDQDGWRKTYFYIKAYERWSYKTPKLDAVVLEWKKDIEDLGGLKKIRGDYFESPANPNGRNHPNAVYAESFDV